MKPSIVNMFLNKVIPQLHYTVEEINKPIKKLMTSNVRLKKEKKKPIERKFIKRKSTEEKKRYEDYPFHYNIDNYGYLATVKGRKAYTDNYEPSELEVLPIRVSSQIR